MLKNPFDRFKLCVGGSGEAGYSSGGSEPDASYDSGDPGSESTAPGVSTYTGSDVNPGQSNVSQAYTGVLSAAAGGGYAGGYTGAGATAEQAAAAAATAAAAGDHARAAAIVAATDPIKSAEYLSHVEFVTGISYYDPALAKGTQLYTGRNGSDDLRNVGPTVTFVTKPTPPPQSPIVTPGYYDTIYPTLIAGSVAQREAMTYGQVLGKVTPAINGVIQRFYMPEGNYAQQELSNIKLGLAKDGYGRSTGEAGIYEMLPGGRMNVNYETGELSPWMLAGGGGRNFAQSGTAGFAAATPVVYGRGMVGSGIFKDADIIAPGVKESGITAAEVLASPSLFSRLGAEAYGGIVTRQDARVLGNITYEDVSNRAAWNLASYVNPTDVNIPKSELPGMDIPWSVPSETPAMFSLTTKGGVGAQITTKPFEAYVSGDVQVQPKSRGMQIPSGIPTPPTPVGVLPYATIGTTDIPTYAHDVIENMKVTPYGLGGVYYLSEFIGKQMSVEQQGMVVDFYNKLPFTGVVRSGVEAFVAKSDYEKIATIREKEVAALLPSYEANLAGYNAQKSQYEQSPTQEGYESLLSKHSALTSERDVIESKISDVKTAETEYTKIAGELTGDVKQSELVTYGLGSWIGGVGKGYRETIEDPIRKVAAPYGFVGDVGIGLATVPSMLLTSGQAALIGGETIVRKPESAAAIATAGVFMMGKGVYDLAVTHPGELVGSIAGMLILGKVGGTAIRRTAGVISTRGAKYISIEDIGYPPEGRYPINPKQDWGLLRRSFYEGRLHPAPKKMAEGGAVPYLHGEGGVPVARLPNAVPGDATIWTALESSSRSKGIGVGEPYKLVTSGGSEVQGAYGAPITESYFTKVGSGKPQIVDMSVKSALDEIVKFVRDPFKTPTIYSTVVPDVEAVPASVARGADYVQINKYVQARSASVPAGQAYMPMLKAEYEAIIPDNTIIEVTGKNYYTKLGGYGKSHFLGQRIPIIEQIARGFEPGDVVSNIPRVNPGESYVPGRTALFSYVVLPSVISSVATAPVGPSQPGTSSAGLSKSMYSSNAGSISTPTETPEHPSHASSYASPSSSNTQRSFLSSPVESSPVESSRLQPSSSLPISEYALSSYITAPSSVPSSPSGGSPSGGSPSGGSPSGGSPSGSSGGSTSSPPSSYSALSSSSVSPVSPKTPTAPFIFKKKKEEEEKYKMQTRKYFPFAEWFRVGEGVEWESFIGIVPTRSARIIKSHPKIIPPDKVPDKVYSQREYAPVPRNLKNPVQFGFIERSLSFHAGQGLTQPQQLQHVASQRRTAPPARVIQNRPIVGQIKKSKPINFGSRKKSMRF